jgi:hypothetical protein
MKMTRNVLFIAFAFAAAVLPAQSQNNDLKEYNAKLEEFRNLVIGKWIDYSTSYTVYAPDATRSLRPPRNTIRALDRPFVNTNENKDEWIEFRRDFSGTLFRFGKEQPIIWRVAPLQAKDLNPSLQNGPPTVVRGIFELTLSTPQGELVHEVVVVDSNLLLLQYIMDPEFGVVRVMNKILMRDPGQIGRTQ